MSDDPRDRALRTINAALKVPAEHPVTAVLIDGHEEGSTILLIRPGARDIAIAGTAALNAPVRLQAAVQAATHAWCPKLDAAQVAKLVNAVYTVAATRSIYDSVSSARDWGLAYVFGARNEEPLELDDRDAKWKRFDSLGSDDDLYRAAGDDDDRAARPCRIVRLAGEHDGSALVIRPWFHDFAKAIAREPGLSEQRIATLMSRAGWEKWPSARSAITAHDPDDNARTRQFRFYVVPAGWTEPDDDDDEVDAAATPSTIWDDWDDIDG